MALGFQRHLHHAAASLLVAPDGRAVRIHLFPPDVRLAGDVSRAWARLAPDRADAVAFRHDLEAMLRRWYPLLTIHPQDSFGSVRQGEAVWYVFRDGRVANEKPWRDEMYGALARARETTESIQDTIRRSLAAIEAANRPRPRRVAPRAAAAGTTRLGRPTPGRAAGTREPSAAGGPSTDGFGEAPDGRA